MKSTWPSTYNSKIMKSNDGLLLDQNFSKPSDMTMEQICKYLSWNITIMQANIFSPKNWIPEQKMLGRNFIFYVMVAGIADQAFKGIRTIDELLSKRPPKGRESWTLEWEVHARRRPVLRMVSTNGPHPIRALTFASLRHNFTSLAQREHFRDMLRIHGIRGRVATSIDGKFGSLIYTLLY